MSESDPQNTGIPAWIKLLVLAGIVLAAALADVVYNRVSDRSAVVEANSGSVRLVLSRELNGKFFENAIICRVKQNDSPVVDGAPYGCSGRTHDLTPSPKDDNREVGRENYNLTLPAGTEILLSARPGLVALRVVAVPEAYATSEAAQLLGGGVILDADAIPAFGTLVMTGKAVIGASQSETDLISITEGSYQFSGRTPTTLLDGQWRVIHSGKLLSGSTVYFADRGDDKTGPLDTAVGETRLTVSIPDPGSSLLRVTGIAADGPAALKIAYYAAMGPTVRPSITNVLLADPILTFLAALILGLITVYQFLRSPD